MIKKLNEIHNKRAMRNPYKSLIEERIEGEGLVLVDEKNDKMHFINASGLILWKEIRQNADDVDTIFMRYKSRIIEIYTFVNEEIIEESFCKFLENLEQNELIILSN